MKSVQNLEQNFARKAITYMRISTDRQQREGDGLRSQETACREYAQRHGFEVVAAFSDVMSGKHAERPGMEKMLKYLRKNRADHIVVIIDDISRLARDMMSYLYLREEISAAGGELKSPKMNFSDDPAFQLPEKMMALMVEHERIANAQRSQDRMRARLQNGYWTFHPPKGYRFADDPNRGGRIMVRNEPTASIVAEALTMFATGQIETQAEFGRYLDSHPGYEKGKTGRTPKQSFRDMLTNPLMAGYIRYEKWGIPLIKAQHEALISLETHKQIIARLEGRPVLPMRNTVNADFPLRGFVLCSDCQKPYRAAWSKSRNGKLHGYYVCQTKGCASYGKSARKADVEGKFEEILAELTPGRELIGLATRIFKDLWDGHIAQAKERQVAAREALKDTEKRLQAVIARAVHATQPALITAYDNEIARLEMERAVEEEKLARMGAENRFELPAFDDAYRTAMDFLANPLKLWRSERFECQRALVKMLFTQQLEYCRSSGYRTAQIALPARVLQGFGDQKSGVVPLT